MTGPSYNLPTGATFERWFESKGQNHVLHVIRWDEQTLRIYFDGEYLNAIVLRDEEDLPHFEGRIDAATFYAKALSLDEIKARLHGAEKDST